MEALTRFFGALVSGGLFPVFLIAAAGYLLGSVELGGVRLGTSAVFLTALLFGHFALSQGAPLQRAGLIPDDTAALEHTFRLVQNLGLLLFVTAVGLIAGPGFFRDFRRNVGSYVLLAAVIIGIIVVTSVFVISNSFRISVAEKRIQLGILASVGATKRQIKRLVVLEGFYIGAVGTALGILLGMAVVAILTVIVQALGGDYFGIGFRVVFIGRIGKPLELDLTVLGDRLI